MSANHGEIFDDCLRHFQVAYTDFVHGGGDGSHDLGIIGQFKGNDVTGYFNSTAGFFLFEVHKLCASYSLRYNHVNIGGSMKKATAEYPDFIGWLAKLVEIAELPEWLK